MSITPSAKPAIKRDKLERLALKQWRALGNTGQLPAVYVVGVPGYFLNSMGKAGVNDRGIYDDAFIVVTPTAYATFNGSTDPSVYRPQVATLKSPQVIWYKPGMHRAGSAGGHPAFRQDSPVIVRRDNLDKPAGYRHSSRGISVGNGYWTDDGYPERFWCNNHKGGYGTTSSLGCLTLPPPQWSAYYALVMSEMKRHGVSRFPMVLIPGPIN